MYVIKAIKDSIDKNKKPTMVQITRDADERLIKAFRIGAKAGLNKSRFFFTLWTSGDQMIQGYRVGDIMAVQMMNEEYIFFVKKNWWEFWKRKTVPIHVDPELCTDMNTKHIVVDAKNIEAVTEGEYYLVPQYQTDNLELIYAQRANTRTVRFLKQSLIDTDKDTDYIVKAALRGDVISAMSEIAKFEDMPEFKEEQMKKRQQQAYNNFKNPEGEGS